MQTACVGPQVPTNRKEVGLSYSPASWLEERKSYCVHPRAALHLAVVLPNTTICLQALPQGSAVSESSDSLLTRLPKCAQAGGPESRAGALGDM